MAGLTPRMDNFIKLLLDVSGRARPGDIHGVSEAEASQALEIYAEVHASEGLVFDNGVLMFAPMHPPAPTGAPQSGPSETGSEVAAVPSGDAAASELPAWVYEGAPDLSPASADVPPAPVAFEPTAGADSSAVAASWDAQPQPHTPVPAAAEWNAQTLPAEETPAWMVADDGGAFVDTTAPAAYAAPTPMPFDAAPAVAPQPVGGTPAAESFPPAPSPADYGAPNTQPPAFYGAQPAAEAVYAAPATPSSAASAADYAEPAGPEASESGDFLGELRQVEMPSEEPVAWWWYVLAFLIPIVGIIGFFVLKATSPKGARKVLIVALVSIALSVLASLLAVFLGASLYMAPTVP